MGLELKVEELTLVHDWGDEDREPIMPIMPAALGRFIDRIHNLTHLTLLDEYLPRYSEVLGELRLTATTLKSLNLASPPLDDFYSIASDDILPRFSNLVHLDLGKSTISEEAVSYLCQLPHLVSLRFGEDVQFEGPSSADLLSLVDGPQRIETLKILEFTSINGKQGDWTQIGDRVGEYFNFKDGGWEIPDFAAWEIDELRRLREVCESNGVELKGGIIEALDIWEAVRLERGNRLILKVYQTRSLAKYTQWSNNDDFRLPNLDVDNLDPQNLKIVEVRPPEEGWVQFTLVSDIGEAASVDECDG